MRARENLRPRIRNRNRRSLRLSGLGRSLCGWTLARLCLHLLLAHLLLGFLFSFLLPLFLPLRCCLFRRQNRVKSISFLAGAEFYNALRFYVFDEAL